MLRRVLLFCCISSAVLTDPPCVIELECAECLPDNMPLVASHRASNGTVTAEAGDELVLECRGGKFLAYPLLATLSAVCEAGRYRVARDGTLRHLLELGCQENIFEDVLHEVEYCSPPLQGRAYQLQTAHGAHHLATLCFDQDRGVATRALATNSPSNALPLPQHRDHASTRSLLGNFNQMFDSSTRNAAEKLYSDDVSTNHRLREILKHDRFTFADQTLTSAELLSTHYFDDQYMRVAKFVSNKVAVWRSVATGNLHHLHRDVAKFMKMSRPHTVVNVYAGTHDVLSLRTGHTKTKIFLKPERFPVPKYIWTVVHDKKQEKALAIAVLNDPFVSVSEIREAVFCESACGSVSWLHELRRHRHYESPVYGLVFCCNVHNFTRVVTEMPEDIVKNVPVGNAGMLTDLYT
ncbi:unnamed protein product [Parnassius mnemosyne]|uniref:DNA/RNA non-specific endonuclease domain-containing protein n=1 Tax=Parnassius mnemosyne TaxID=213953 RepID=A0AAV1KXI3_9NEOP